MKSAEEIMEILEAYDLTGSFRDAAELAGCSHHTVAAHVTARDTGRATGTAVARPQLIDEYLAKVEAATWSAVATSWRREYRRRVRSRRLRPGYEGTRDLPRDNPGCHLRVRPSGSTCRRTDRAQSRIFHCTALLTCTFIRHSCTALRRS